MAKRYVELETFVRTVGATPHCSLGTALCIANNYSTADVAEVVRCKDCKHYFHYGKTSLFIDGENVKAGWCHRRTRYDEEYRMTPDDFCSYGEKKRKS